MSADFNWWLLLLGMVIGGALAWLVLADSNRHDRDIEDVETAAEATWIARSIGAPLDPETAERVLQAHRRYLGFPPPDMLVDPAELHGGRRPVDPGDTPEIPPESAPITASAGSDAPG
jgi:hypothetical protein